MIIKQNLDKNKLVWAHGQTNSSSNMACSVRVPQEEAQRFEHERSERVRLMQEKQARELEEFDKESLRMGLS